MANPEFVQSLLPGLDSETLDTIAALSEYTNVPEIYSWVKSHGKEGQSLTQICNEIGVFSLPTFITSELFQRIAGRFENQDQNNLENLIKLGTIYNEITVEDNQQPEKYWDY